MNRTTIRVFLVGAGLTALISAQAPGPQAPSTQAPRRTAPRGTGTVQGTVKDDTGGVIPNAVVTLASENGTAQTTKTGGDGSYTFRGVAPGTYTVSTTYAGLQQQGVTAISVTSGQAATGNVVMTVQAQRQELTVTDTSTNTVSTEASNNATALVLKKEDLDALPDDPDDLQADLQALAGPSAGPGGNQIFIDGFSGGRLPPKESIREIRINSNPFSAEFDKLGYGRIQIFTKPGSDKFHGQSYYNISDGIWNSRNPFLVTPGFSDPPFRTQLFGGNVSGPITKHASFFVDAERRQIDDNGIVTATIPTADFLGTQPYQIYHSTPQRRTTVSPRVDYQLGANNTLSFRYSYLQNDRLLTGIAGFNLPETPVGNITYPSSGYASSTTDHEAQIVETAVLSPKIVNETHFQYERTYATNTSQSLAPALNVSQSFVAGGSGYSAPGYPGSYDLENYYELQNYTSMTLGAHTMKFGIRARTTALDDSTPKSFNGIYSFLGSSTMSSIQQYLTTVQLLNAGYSSQQVTAMGYGPSKYTVQAGNPYIHLTQSDFGPFAQDDWRVRPNLTLSFGLRWESQTNIYDHSDWAPRFGFAWSPDSKGGTGRAKTVIRGGWGVFYDRFTITNVVTAARYLTQNPLQTYTIDKPTAYDAAFDTQIPLSGLTATDSGQIYQIDRHLQAPRLMQTAIGIERQMFGHTTLSFNFMNSRGVHVLRTVNINSPYPIPGRLPPGIDPTATLGRPYGIVNGIADIYDYQSDGIFKQTMALVNVNTSVGRWLTLFGRYSYGTAHSDTDGLSSQPSNPYNFAADWGRSQLDISHNLFLGGSILGPWGLRFSPFIVAHSGTPFNVTTGTDQYFTGSSQPTARPAVNSGTNLYYGVPASVSDYNLSPVVAAPGTSNLIERYAGTGPGFVGLNLRVSKTWGFGTTKFSGPSGGSRGGGRGGPGGGGGRGGPGGPGGGGFGGGGPRGFGGESTEHRYNLTLGINARNIINHENLNTVNGALISPYFLDSTGITGGFGAEQTASNQRRIDIQLRFSF
jgi:hypothetical protein